MVQEQTDVFEKLQCAKIFSLEIVIILKGFMEHLKKRWIEQSLDFVCAWFVLNICYQYAAQICVS